MDARDLAVISAFLFPRAMSQAPCLHEHKVSKLAWRMPRGSTTQQLYSWIVDYFTAQTPFQALRI